MNAQASLVSRAGVAQNLINFLRGVQHGDPEGF
jgi:hypothetical protein